MGVRLGGRRRHERLPWQDNVAGLLLLREMGRDVRVIGLHISNEAAQVPLRLEILSGKVGDEFKGSIEDFRRG